MDTSDSDLAMETLTRFIADTESATALLTGGAGTGKTYLVQGFLKKVNIKPSDVRISAPTNKAVSVLKSKLDTDYQSSCFTIHKLLHAEEDYDDQGNMSMKCSLNKNDWVDIDLLIIDESSMLSKDIFDILIKDRPEHLKILFIGDKCQLPPVDEPHSPAFHHVHDYTCDLINTKRTDIPELTQIYDVFRAWQYTDQDLRRVLVRSKTGRKILCDAVDFRKAIKDRIGVKDTCVLAYSNDRVKTYNEYARKVLFPNTDQKWCVGEKGIFDAPCSSGGMKFHTNDTFEIQKLEIKVSEISSPHHDFFIIDKKFPAARYAKYIPVKQYVFSIEDGYEFARVHEDSENTFDVYRRGVRAHLRDYIATGNVSAGVVSDLWRCFHNWVKKINAPIIYAYAMTIHKSQGSGIGHVLIDAENVECCTQYSETLKKQCMYTAVTRSKNSVLIRW